MKSRDCLESSRLCESTLGDETALEAEVTGNAVDWGDLVYRGTWGAAGIHGEPRASELGEGTR